MKTLQRITTEFSEIEDRIKLTGEISAEETITLWLNHRLLVRLMPHLFTWLESQNGTSFPAEIAHSLAQEAAKAELSDEPPVQKTPNTEEWLVEAVDLTLNSQNFTLTFRADNQVPIVLQLPMLHLRQWLEILHSLWRIAEWPMQVWPQWLHNGAKDEELVSTNTLLH